MGSALQQVDWMEQVVLHFVTSAGGEPISTIIQLDKVLRVSGLSERTLLYKEGRRSGGVDFDTSCP